VCKFVVREPEVPIDLCGYLNTLDSRIKTYTVYMGQLPKE